MSCINYCNLELNKFYNWTDTSIFCNQCGHDNHRNLITVQYKYKNKGEHVFYIPTIICPECKFTITTLHAPCGGSYYFNESDVSESLLVPQEFIIRK